jgi:hypothetical protein
MKMKRSCNVQTCGVVTRKGGSTLVHYWHLNGKQVANRPPKALRMLAQSSSHLLLNMQ